jgi:predicted phosphodiesterase
MFATHRRLVTLLLGGFVCTSAVALAQNEPFIVHDTKPVIVHGPYLVDPGETAMTIVWVTDTPAHSKVLYGEGEVPDREREPSEHGLLPVGTLHRVTLTGLEPGRTYRYQVVSTRVVRLKAYWPEKGLSVESPVYAFRTLDRRRPTVSFASLGDTHEQVARIRTLTALVDWSATDFLVHTGDAFDWLADEDQLFDRFLDPVSHALGHTTPLVFVRGNHEMRGPFARQLFAYLPVSTGRFYHAFDDGPAHFVVLDSGEDKDDDTNVYAGLNRVEPYRQEELAWFRTHLETDVRVGDAPFRIVLIHQPDWGYVGGENDRWTAVANRGGIDLVVAGHLHRYQHVRPGERGNDFHIVAVGQDQVARVDVTPTELTVTVRNAAGRVVEAFTVPVRDRR